MPSKSEVVQSYLFHDDQSTESILDEEMTSEWLARDFVNLLWRHIIDATLYSHFVAKIKRSWQKTPPRDFFFFTHPLFFFLGLLGSLICSSLSFLHQSFCVCKDSRLPSSSLCLFFAIRCPIWINVDRCIKFSIDVLLLYIALISGNMQAKTLEVVKTLLVSLAILPGLISAGPAQIQYIGTVRDFR